MSSRRRKLVDEASGIGKLYRGSEYIADVLYSLQTFQEQIYPRPGDDPIMGLKHITGRISSLDKNNVFLISSHIGEDLTLHLEDGRRFDMFIKNSDGEMVNRAGGLGLYSPTD